MGDISKNFNRKEFACKCGCGFDDVNPRLVEVVQTIRDAIGEPITISSGCRCAEHNKKVGGVNGSQHTQATAADLHTPLSSLMLFHAIISLYDDGKIPALGYCQRYNWGCHVDVREKKARNIFNG